MPELLVNNLEKLRKSLIIKAREIAYKIILDAKKERERIIKEYEEKAKKEAEKIIKMAKLEAKWVRNRIIAEALLKVREKRILEKWEKAKAKLEQ